MVSCKGILRFIPNTLCHSVLSTSKRNMFELGKVFVCLFHCFCFSDLFFGGRGAGRIGSGCAGFGFARGSLRKLPTRRLLTSVALSFKTAHELYSPMLFAFPRPALEVRSGQPMFSYLDNRHTHQTDNMGGYLPNVHIIYGDLVNVARSVAKSLLSCSFTPTDLCESSCSEESASVVNPQATCEIHSPPSQAQGMVAGVCRPSDRRTYWSRAS